MMERIHLKLIREHVVISIYQYILIQLNIEDTHTYLTGGYEPIEDQADLDRCIEIVTKIRDHFDVLSKIIADKLKKNWSLDRIARLEYAILVVATYELLYLKKPKHIVINEAIELAKKYCDENSYKFINGILNSIDE